MSRDEHAFRRSLALGFTYSEYPQGRFAFDSPPGPTDPADAAEVEAIRNHLRNHWPRLTPLVAGHLAEQRWASQRFE